jgi:hypothetical protein
MTSNVFKFPVSVSRRSRARLSRASNLGAPEEQAASREIVDAQTDNRRPAKSVSVTAENGRLRDERHEVWRMAEVSTRYWRHRTEFDDAVSWAQRVGVLEGSFHPAVNSDHRGPNVARYRAALVNQLLTPAWDVASVKWKQQALAGGQHRYTDVKPERIERAIADDLEFLAAHPVRRSDSEAATRKREFNDAMRQRIRDVAVSRDLSEEEIKPALRLTHEEIVKFVEKHGVNWPWLLEGKGRIFESAVVKTLRPADQETIRATVREILQERDQ